MLQSAFNRMNISLLVKSYRLFLYMKYRFQHSFCCFLLQFAIVFKTPQFEPKLATNGPVNVNIFLRCPSKNQRSEPKTFQYFPDDPGHCCDIVSFLHHISVALFWIVNVELLLFSVSESKLSEWQINSVD